MKYLTARFFTLQAKQRLTGKILNDYRCYSVKFARANKLFISFLIGCPGFNISQGSKKGSLQYGEEGSPVHIDSQGVLFKHPAMI